MGVPTGGERLSAKLEQYVDPYSDNFLIVDDVLTTGSSMEQIKSQKDQKYMFVKGVVIFARGKCPDWVTPIF